MIYPDDRLKINIVEYFKQNTNIAGSAFRVTSTLMGIFYSLCSAEVEEFRVPLFRNIQKYKQLCLYPAIFTLIHLSNVTTKIALTVP